MFRFSQFAAPVMAGALFLGAGCASDHPDEVPVTAQPLVEGSRTVTSIAPHDGTVYIWDRNSDEMIYTGQVKKGDTVTVDAKKDRVMFNNMVASERTLTDSHNYKVFFERSKEPDQADVARYKEGSTVIQSDRGATVVQPGDRGATIVAPAPVQPAPQPQSNTTIIQPAPAQQPPPQPQSNTTIIQPAPQPQQPEGTTITVQPSR